MPDVLVRLTSITAPLRQSVEPPTPVSSYYSASPWLPDEDKWKARAGADGTVTFPNLPQGFDAHYRIEDKRFAFAGEVNAISLLLGGAGARLDERALTSAAPQILIPAPSASIAGRLTFALSGKPLVGAIVRVSLTGTYRGGESITNEKGEFKFSGLRAGRYDGDCVLRTFCVIT